MLNAFVRLVVDILPLPLGLTAGVPGISSDTSLEGKAHPAGGGLARGGERGGEPSMAERRKKVTPI